MRNSLASSVHRSRRRKQCPRPTECSPPRPIWAQFGWGLGVWGGLLGSLLLLAKNRYAFHVLLLSLIGCVISLGWQMLADTNPPPGMDSSMNTVMPLIIIAVAAGLFLYARAMRAKGVLR